MSEPFIGQIYLVGYNFAQRNFALAQGQILPINSNQALFSLYGTTYGGDGRTSFALPDLRGRCALGMGNGPGLTSRPIGARGGSETTTLTGNNVPPHSHPVKASGEEGNLPGPGTDFLSKAPAGGQNIYHNGPGNRTMDAGMIANSTSPNQSFNNMQPFLVLNYEVALQGVFPSRN